MRLKAAGAAIAVAAILGGTMAPARAATQTHTCEAAFEDPTLAAVCGVVVRTVCAATPICL